MFFGRYELQVLDSFQNLTYADGQAAAIYGQYPHWSTPVANRASGRPTTSSSPHLGSSRTARSTRPLLSRCSTMAYWYTTIHKSSAPCPFESSPSTRPTGPRGQSCYRTTVTPSGFATSGSVRSKATTNHERHLVAKRVGANSIDSKRQSCDESGAVIGAIWHSAVENV